MKIQLFLPSLILLLIIFLTLNSISANSSLSTVYPNKPWTSQASGCQEVSGNINQTLTYVYLGSGSSVPSSISNQYPKASAGFLEDWKTNMLAMKVSQFKAFIIPAADGYPSGQLAGKDLYFQTTILVLYNIDCNGVTDRNSLVNVLYSLYTDCKISGGSQVASTGITPILSSCFSNPASPQATDILGLVIGAILLAGILGGVGFFIYNGRKPSLNTQTLMEKTKQKESNSIKSLKDSLGSNTEDLNSNVKPSRNSARRRKH